MRRACYLDRGEKELACTSTEREAEKQTGKLANTTMVMSLALLNKNDDDGDYRSALAIEDTR
jgi:hypothetical protein